MARGASNVVTEVQRLWLLAVLVCLSACAAPPMPAMAAPAEPTGSDAGPIVVLGDTQRTSWAESFFCGREQNETARRALMARIAAEERPAFIVHLGDMVSDGTSDEQWEYFDRLISPLTARQLPIFPVLGNHDTSGDWCQVLRHVQQRFPQFAQGRWYAMRHRGLGFVWLDSNLDEDCGRQQAAWLQNTLREFDRDPRIRGVLVFTHHPPYTNGSGREGDHYVVTEVLPRFFRAHKAVVMMSGHVHGYERFHACGRTFVVTGGAGGPRVDYRVGSDAPNVPSYVTAKGDPRPFNYVVIRDAGSRLLFTVKCLRSPGACPDGVLERFSVDLPEARPLPSPRQSGRLVPPARNRDPNDVSGARCRYGSRQYRGTSLSSRFGTVAPPRQPVGAHSNRHARQCWSGLDRICHGPSLACLWRPSSESDLLDQALALRLRSPVWGQGRFGFVTSRYNRATTRRGWSRDDETAFGSMVCSDRSGMPGHGRLRRRF